MAGVAPRLDHLPEERSNSEGIVLVDVKPVLASVSLFSTLTDSCW